MNWCGNRIDDTKEFVSDALTTGKEFVKGQCERGSEFWNNPSLISGLDWFSGGYVSACNQRYQEADDLYGYANWALSGIPDMVKGAFAPEKPGSFQHFMDSLGVATLLSSVVSGATKVRSKNKNASTSVKSTVKSIDEILDDATPGRVTKGRAIQYVKTGGYAQALDDFADMGVINVRDIPYGKVGTLPDGRTVNVRAKSSYSTPTLEIQDGKSSIKIRYED